MRACGTACRVCNPDTLPHTRPGEARISPLTGEVYRVWGRSGAASFIEGPLSGHYEVWATDGSIGDPQCFTSWESAVEAYEYALTGYNVTTRVQS